MPHSAETNHSKHNRTPEIGMIVALLTGILIALQPLMRGQITWHGDGLLNLYRLPQLDRAMRFGELYPRWLPDMGYGLGFPLFNYYAPFGFFVVEPLLYIGISAQASLLVSFGLALVVCVVGVFLWTRELFGTKAGVVAGFAASFAPYYLYNIYHRGALAEVWGVAWFPVAAWALHRLITDKGTKWVVIFAGCYGTLILSHSILSLVCSPLLALYAVVLAVFHQNKESCVVKNQTFFQRRYQWIVIAFLLGMCLSAFFWMPAYFEQDQVQMNRIYSLSRYDYHNNFSSLSEIFSAPFTADMDQLALAVPRSIGWIQALLACLAVVVSLKKGIRNRPAVIFLFTGSVALLLMCLPFSALIWDTLPMMHYIQFPWRLLGPAGVMIAVLAGAGSSKLPGKYTMVAVASAIALFALPWLFPHKFSVPTKLDPPDLIRWEGESLAVGTTAAAEFIPKWVKKIPPADYMLSHYDQAAPDFIIPRFDQDSLPVGGMILDQKNGPRITSTQVTVDSPENFVARFLWYYYPGWTVRVDGETVQARPDTPYGLVTADVPKGIHRIEVEFKQTPIRQLASGITLATLGIIVVTGLWSWKFKGVNESPERMSTSTLPETTHRSIIPLIIAGLVIFSLKTLYIDRHDTIFRQSRFDGQQVSHVDVPLEINFQNEVELMGLDIESTEIRGDDTLEVALYWRALQLLDSDYSVALHLVDRHGQLYGQLDHLHPVDHPTTHWRLDEYARDEYVLDVWPATPPGEYSLLVSVYEFGSGRTLGIIDDSGFSSGTSYDLVSISIARSSKPPKIADLHLEREMFHNVGAGFTLLGSSIETGIEVKEGDFLEFSLYWLSEHSPMADYQARLRFVAPDGKSISEFIANPGNHDAKTSSWKSGDIHRGNWSIQIPPVSTSTNLILALELIDGNNQSLGSSLELATVTVNSSLPRVYTLTPPRHSLNTTLGPSDTMDSLPVAILMGYDLGSNAQTGTDLTVTLYWQAASTAETSYTVFVHLLNNEEELVAQSDNIPANSLRPTTGWLNGEFITDNHILSLPQDMPAGEYHLQVGMYDLHTGARLLQLDEDGIPIDDNILLTPDVSVTTSPN